MMDVPTSRLFPARRPNVLTGEGDNDKLDCGTNDGGIGNDKCNTTGSVNCEARLDGDECPT